VSQNRSLQFIFPNSYGDHKEKPEEISPELKAKMKASIKPEQGTLWFRKAEAYIIPNDSNSIILLDNEITFLWVTSGYLPFL
jgi:hypothetical protein